MINPLQIALQGLAPGSPPITIATQGLVITIAQPEVQKDALWQPLRSFGPPDATPYDSRKKRTKRIDCVVNVEGCKATLSTYAGNIRRIAFEKEVVIPQAIRFLETILNWKADNQWKAIPKNASRRRQKAEELLTGRKKKRQLRDDANSFAASINPADLPDVARMLHHYILENARLNKLLQEKTR